MKEIMATDLVRAKTVSNQCKLSFPAAVHTFSPYRGVFDGAFPLTVSRVLRAAKYTNILSCVPVHQHKPYVEIK